MQRKDGPKAHHITRISKIVDLTQGDTLRDLASKECEGHDMLFSWTLVSHIVVLVPGSWKEAPGSTCRDALHCSAGLAERWCRVSTCSITTGSEGTPCTSATVCLWGRVTLWNNSRLVRVHGEVSCQWMKNNRIWFGMTIGQIVQTYSSAGTSSTSTSAGDPAAALLGSDM